jgi:hypothetical protein
VKTVATFWKPEEAHLLRLRLCEAGIPAFLQDEHSTQLHPWRAAAIGGVRVQVDDADFDAAKLLASGLETESAGAPKAMPLDPDAIECCCCRARMASSQSRCSTCGWSYEDEDPADGRPGPERANV